MTEDALSPSGLLPLGLSLTNLTIPGIVLWLTLFFGIGLVGTWLARGYALRHRMIDHPGERRSHDTPTPRGGGIAIVVALLLALAWLSASDTSRVMLHMAIAIGLLLVAGVGWADDHKPLPIVLRLATHVLAAAILAWGVQQVGGSGPGTVLAFVLSLALVNIWNFMDGIDGLAGGQAILAALGYALLAGQGPAAWLGLALAAACAGFLPFNLPKARIFLGDVGSGALGFALAGLIVLMMASDVAMVPVLLLPVSAFVIDATLTLGSRIVRRESWWLPHTRHAYQRWTRTMGRHDVVTWAYAGWTTITVLVMLGVSNSTPTGMIASTGITYIAGAIIWWRLQRMADMLETGVRE